MVLSVEMEPIPSERFTWNLLGPFRDADVKIKWLHWHPSPTMGLRMENPIPERFSMKGNTNLSETQVLELAYWKGNTTHAWPIIVHFFLLDPSNKVEVKQKADSCQTKTKSTKSGCKLSEVQILCPCHHCPTFLRACHVTYFSTLFLILLRTLKNRNHINHKKSFGNK